MSQLRARKVRARFPVGLLAGAVLIQAASTPGQTIGLSVLVDPIIDELSVSRSAVSTAYLVGTLLGALALGPVGRLLDRHGVRRVAVVLGFSFGLVVAAMAWATGIVTLGIGFVGTRALGQGALSLTATTAIVVGFDRRRGFALGMQSALGSALMSVVPLGIVISLDHVSLGATWVLLGVAATAIVVGVAISPLLDQRDPIDDPHAAGHVEPERPAGPGWSPTSAYRTPAFLVTIVAGGFSALIATALIFHHVDLLNQRGLTDAQAAANFVPQTIAAAVGAIWVGRLADRLRPQTLIAACMVTLGTACLLVQAVSPGLTAALYGIALGAAGSSMRAVEAAALARWFGVAHIGEIRGVVMVAMVAASAIGPVLLALGSEHLGGYRPMLLFLAICSFVVAALAAVTDAPRQRTSVAEQR